MHPATYTFALKLPALAGRALFTSNDGPQELTPALLTLGEVQRVLHALLAENVSIRDLVRIFEALSVRAKVSTDVDGTVIAVFVHFPGAS